MLMNDRLYKDQREVASKGQHFYLLLRRDTQEHSYAQNAKAVQGKS